MSRILLFFSKNACFIALSILILACNKEENPVDPLGSNKDNLPDPTDSVYCIPPSIDARYIKNYILKEDFLDNRNNWIFERDTSRMDTTFIVDDADSSISYAKIENGTLILRGNRAKEYVTAYLPLTLPSWDYYVEIKYIKLHEFWNQDDAVSDGKGFSLRKDSLTIFRTVSDDHGDVRLDGITITARIRFNSNSQALEVCLDSPVPYTGSHTTEINDLFDFHVFSNNPIEGLFFTVTPGFGGVYDWQYYSGEPYIIDYIYIYKLK